MLAAMLHSQSAWHWTKQAAAHPLKDVSMMLQHSISMDVASITWLPRRDIRPDFEFLQHKHILATGMPDRKQAGELRLMHDAKMAVSGHAMTQWPVIAGTLAPRQVMLRN